MKKTIDELKANAILIKDWAMDLRAAATEDGDTEDWTTTAYYAPAELVRRLGLTLDYDVCRDFDWINFCAADKIVRDGKEYVLIAEVGGCYSDIDRQRTTASCANYCADTDGDIVEVVDHIDFDDCEHIDEDLNDAINHYRWYCNDSYPQAPSEEDLDLLLSNDIISQEEYNEASNI